jgi:hypothetical protein
VNWHRYQTMQPEHQDMIAITIVIGSIVVVIFFALRAASSL